MARRAGAIAPPDDWQAAPSAATFKGTTRAAPSKGVRRMAASFARTTESARRAFDVPSWVMLCEASTAEAAAAAKDVVRAELARHRIDAPGVGAVYALEICRLAANASVG